MPCGWGIVSTASIQTSRSRRRWPRPAADPTEHAEIPALREVARKRGDDRLTGVSCF
jgi:tRNA(Arg) A34 adenosine deaminase TadA